MYWLSSEHKIQFMAQIVHCAEFGLADIFSWHQYNFMFDHSSCLGISLQIGSKAVMLEKKNVANVEKKL